jgi:Tfp pilus assembly protein PilV
MSRNNERVMPEDSAGRGQHGFSTIEALIAVVMLSIAMLPLIALQGQAARQAAQLSAFEARLQAGQMLLARVSELNPMAQPEGRETFGALELVWTSRRISDETAPGMSPGDPSRYLVAMYEVNAEVRRDGDPVTSIRVYQLGWRLTGPMLPL